jgi:hypothetical protein
MVNPGNPTPTCTSTSTARPTTPSSVVERTLANMNPPDDDFFDTQVPRARDQNAELSGRDL